VRMPAGRTRPVSRSHPGVSFGRPTRGQGGPYLFIASRLRLGATRELFVASKTRMSVHPAHPARESKAQPYRASRSRDSSARRSWFCGVRSFGLRDPMLAAPNTDLPAKARLLLEKRLRFSGRQLSAGSAPFESWFRAATGWDGQRVVPGSWLDEGGARGASYRTVACPRVWVGCLL